MRCVRLVFFFPKGGQEERLVARVSAVRYVCPRCTPGKLLLG